MDSVGVSGHKHGEEEGHAWQGIIIKRLKTIGRIKCLIDTMTSAHDRLAIEAHEKEICRLPAKSYGTTEFDMSDARLQALINAGRKAMKEYFDHQ